MHLKHANVLIYPWKVYLVYLLPLKEVIVPVTVPERDKCE